MTYKEFLGSDLAQIAREKAGIFKAYAPAFSAPQTDLVRAVLTSEAARARTDLKNLDEHFHCYRQHGRLVYESQDQLLDLPLPALAGDHQSINAGLAIAIALSLKIESRAIAKGITSAQWPARLQALTHGPLSQIANAYTAELWLDGGHNPHAARALAGALADMETKSSRPLVLVMGMLANKDAPGFLDAFSGLAQSLIAVPIQDHTSLAAETLMDMAKGRGMGARAADTLTQAVKMACQTKDGQPPRILICGSLYLAGQALGLD